MAVVRVVRRSPSHLRSRPSAVGRQQTLRHQTPSPFQDVVAPSASRRQRLAQSAAGVGMQSQFHDATGRILIDAGEPNVPEYIKNLHETMIKHNFQLDHIIISHWHSDHIGGVKNVLDMIANKNECQVWKFNPKIGKKRDYNFPLHFVEDKQKFEVEGATLIIHHTPGHSSDHIVIFLEEDNALFSADCVLGEGTTVFEDLTEYLKSLQLILDLNPTVIYPGHGSVIKDPIVRVNNYIKHRLEREMELYNLINKSPSGSLSEEEIVNIMYKAIPNDYKRVASYIVKNHLAKLEKDGKVVLIDNKWKINQQ